MALHMIDKSRQEKGLSQPACGGKGRRRRNPRGGKHISKAPNPSCLMGSPHQTDSPVHMDNPVGHEESLSTVAMALHGDEPSTTRETFNTTEGFISIHKIQVESPIVLYEPSKRDDVLLEYFLTKVRPLTCPIARMDRCESSQIDNVLLALSSNRAIMHCCLGSSAMHLKAFTQEVGGLVDHDIERHAYATTVELRTSIQRNNISFEALQAVLSIILLQSLVGRPAECLLEIPWQHHFRAATSILHRLQHSNGFTTALASWIDILGATMLGTSPAFVGMYRQRRIAKMSSGLAHLMGCEDEVMYIIAEIAHLEASKSSGLDEASLMARIVFFDLQITSLEPVLNATTNLSTCAEATPRILLTRDVTALFRIAARIYLWTLCPSYSPEDPQVVGLVEDVGSMLNCMQSGPNGLDCFLVWPLFIAGLSSLPMSSFRTTFSERANQLGNASEIGSFGKVRAILSEMWRRTDEAVSLSELQSPSWRDIVQCKGWNVLII